MLVFFSILKRGVTYVTDHPQLIATVLLLLVVPFAFLFSGEQFLTVARDNQEKLEKDRVGLMHDTFASLLIVADFKPAVAEYEMRKIAELNPDLTKFQVAKEEDGELVVIASLIDDERGEPVANVDRFRLARISRTESIITPTVADGVRYWESYRLVVAADGTEYYIFTETSLAGVDALFASRIVTAYLWLLFVMLIVLLLVIRHVRLIDYQHLYKKAQRTSEAKDLFTNMVAHELRTPLTAIRGYASMIEENETLDQEVREQSRRIEESAERLVAIVNDLLDIARIQRGRLAINKAEFDASKVIDSVLGTLSVRAAAKQIKLTSEGTEDPIMLVNDEHRLHQVLTNMVGNAIKYTQQGTITVAVEDLKDRIELRVKDTGLGIAAQDQKKLFAPFFRVKTEETLSVTGTGLGMWITKQLIDLMGGSIGVESIRGVGTHVVVTFPKKPK